GIEIDLGRIARPHARVAVVADPPATDDVLVAAHAAAAAVGHFATVRQQPPQAMEQVIEPDDHEIGSRAFSWESSSVTWVAPASAPAMRSCTASLARSLAMAPSNIAKVAAWPCVLFQAATMEGLQ